MGERKATRKSSVSPAGSPPLFTSGGHVAAAGWRGAPDLAVHVGRYRYRYLGVCLRPATPGTVAVLSAMWRLVSPSCPRSGEAGALAEEVVELVSRVLASCTRGCAVLLFLLLAAWCRGRPGGAPLVSPSIKLAVFSDRVHFRPLSASASCCHGGRRKEVARRWFLRLFLFLLQLFPLMSELMRAMSPGFAGRTGLTVGAEASVEAAADQRCHRQQFVLVYGPAMK